MRTLSQAGRTTLIKAVATAMPQYCMLTFFLLKGWCDEIDRVIKDFLCGFLTQKKRSFKPKAWDSICLLKTLGGISIRKMYEINLALVAKLGWQFFNDPDRLWVRIAKAKYKNLSPFYPPQVLGNCSVFWKGLCRATPLLSSGICLWPRNGNSVRIKEDLWLPEGLDFKPTWRTDVMMVSQLVWPEVRMWNVDLLRSMFVCAGLSGCHSQATSAESILG